MSRTRHTAGEKARIIRDFEQHDQSAAAFCRQRGICYQTFMNWRRSTAGNPPHPEQTPAFLQFQLGAPHQRPTPSGPLVELELGGGIILRVHPARHVQP